MIKNNPKEFLSTIFNFLDINSTDEEINKIITDKKIGSSSYYPMPDFVRAQLENIFSDEIILLREKFNVSF